MSIKKKQINSLLNRQLSNIIEKEIDIQNCLITISEVDCLLDLSKAKIYVSILPENMALKVIKILNRNKGKFKKILSSKIKIRKIPQLFFLIDDRERRAEEIEEIICQKKISTKTFLIE